jgi:predicted DNA-binding transcriptional regulator YafY
MKAQSHSTSKLGRQLAIWRLLKSTSGTDEGLDLRTLARRFGVSKNTIHRDVDQLSLGGVPITQVLVGQRQLFKMMPGMVPALQLTDEDRRSLAMAQALSAPYRRTPPGRALASTVAKLDARFSDVFVAASPAGLVAPRARVFDGALEAILARRRCRVGHRRRFSGEVRSHELEPYELQLQGGVIYLRGRVLPRGSSVSFAMHLIEQVELLDEMFRRPRRPSFPDRRFGVFDGRAERVEARFHPDIAPYIRERRWHPSQRIEARPDGWLAFNARLSGMHEFVGWLMSWGDRAELLRPLEWRREVLRRARGLTRIHEPSSGRGNKGGHDGGVETA